MIASNHQALYTQILAVAVLWKLSTKVPTAIAIQKTMKSIDVRRVENKKRTNIMACFIAFFFKIKA